MGRYTDNLTRRHRKLPSRVTVNHERLISAAILRLGHCHSGFKSHAEIRTSLGDEDPYRSKPGDTEGFLTNKARFLDRDAARMVAIDAGQVSPHFSRTLLSSDINW